ncbi:MAG: hypothetical protein ACK4JB_05690 [Reyranella sp.]
MRISEPGAPLSVLQRSCFDVEGAAIYYADLNVRLARPMPAGPEAATVNHRSARSHS